MCVCTVSLRMRGCILTTVCRREHTDPKVWMHLLQELSSRCENSTKTERARSKTSVFTHSKSARLKRRRSSNCVSSEQPGWAVLTSFTQMNQKFKYKVCSLYSKSLLQICCLMTSFTRNISGHMKTEVHSEVRVHHMFHHYDRPELFMLNGRYRRSPLSVLCVSLWIPHNGSVLLVVVGGNAAVQPVVQVRRD